MYKFRQILLTDGILVVFIFEAEELATLVLLQRRLLTNDLMTVQHTKYDQVEHK